jgi:hypothetical protein
VRFSGTLAGGDRAVRTSTPFPSLVDGKKSPFVVFIIEPTIPVPIGRFPSTKNYSRIEGEPPFKIPEPFDQAIYRAQFRLKPLPEFKISVRLSYIAYIEIHIEVPSGTREQAQVNSKSRGDCIAVGLCTAAFPMTNKQPGWTRSSIGYHGDDGHVFHRSGHSGRNYGPMFGPGDVVGLGIDYAASRVFYTLNGQLINDPDLLPKMKGEFFPCVGLDSQYPVYLVAQGPFIFDLRSYERARFPEIPISSADVLRKQWRQHYQLFSQQLNVQS